MARGADRIVSASPNVRGQIDEPHGNAFLRGGPILVQGWAFAATSPVSRVDVWLGDRGLGRAGLGHARPEVAAALGEEDAELSGFALDVDLSRYHPLPEHARVRAVVSLLDGTREELPPVEVEIGSAPAGPTAVAPEPSRPALPAGPRPAPRRKMRVLWFARGLDRGGSQLRMKEWIEHLAREGDFVSTVLAPGNGPLRRALKAAGARVRKVPAVSMDDASAYEAGVSALTAWAEGRFDLVVGATLTSFPAIDLAGRLGLPSVLRVGEAEPLRTVVGWLTGDLDAAVESRARRAFDTASVILFNSEAARRTFEEAGVTARMAVLGTGVDVRGARAYVEANRREDCRRTLGVADGRRLLVCAGTLWRVKGQALLTTALRHLRADHPSLECVLIGQADSPYAEAVSRFIRRHRLAACIRILPFCKDLRPWFRAADAAVCPSESESMPASVLEAMAFGLPVLASRVGSLPELVEHGATGWLCEPNDLDSLRDGLVELATASEDDLRARGASAARRVAVAHDGPDTLGRMTDLLRSVVRGSWPPWIDSKDPSPKRS